jgi:predicted AlkP superfamily pyrophosphatase or phosphodiesterase
MFCKPDYNGGSIVNLMSTIGKNFGVDLPYEELGALKANELAGFKNIVHIVIDGLGYNYLAGKRKNFLKDNIAAKITSVFPSTTSACITSFATGLAPQQHGVTGWFVRLREKGYDIPSTILLFNDRRNDELLTKSGILPDDVFIDFRLSKKISDTHVVVPEKLIGSVYTNFLLGGSDKTGYMGLKDFYSRLTGAVKASQGKKNYIYGYLPDLDSVFHKDGSKSVSLTRLFYKIARETEKFFNEIAGTNSLVIITADHGLLDGGQENQLNMNELPQISKMLEFPLCGEPRAAYCYVKDEYKKDFKQIVEKEIGYAVKVMTGKKMIEEGYYGLFEANAKLESRVGDFVLLCKKNFVIKDFLPNEKVKFHAADHGGLSTTEMLVPLIVLKA